MDWKLFLFRKGVRNNPNYWTENRIRALVIVNMWVKDEVFGGQQTTPAAN